MKRKLATLLTLALTVTMLGGCGGSLATSGGSSKTESLSECLSEEKVIAYRVETVDKSKTPAVIYFFENGKVTIIPGEAFGLTMGDFAQMEDKEIWSTYETVRETYAEEYVSNQKEKIQSEIDNINGNIDAIQTEMELFEQEVTGQEGWSEELIEGTKNEYQMRIAEFQASLAELQELQETRTCKGPFYDMPFSFVVKTDSSGNNMQSETLVYPTLAYSMWDDAPSASAYYDAIKFANVDSSEREIYDTTYNCFGLGSGDAIFCTRASMTLDTVKSKNVLIDLSEDEINELFEEEVMARYE